MNVGYHVRSPRVSFFAGLSCLMAAGSLGGCGGSSGGPTWPKGNVVLEDANNYVGQAMLTIPTVVTAPGADLTVCWDAITTDLLCHSLDAKAAIDNVSFAKIPNMSPEQVEAALAIGQLDPNLVLVYREYHVMHAKSETCTNLSKLSFGTPLVPATDYVEDPTKTYMMLFETGTDPAINVKAMTFIKPTAGSTNMAVAAPDPCSANGKILHFSATLGQAISIPKAGPWLVDWSQVTKDAFGTTINFSHLDKVEVAYYAGKTAADIQASFVDIEVSATSLYSVMVPGGSRDVDLAGAKDVTDSTKSFPGFDRSDGVWLVAVLNTKSQTPAPVVLSILQPQ